MSDNKKYYYLKLKENFFDQDHIRAIEAMENGYMYSNIIMKLYLKAVKWDGQLKVTDRVPYSKDPEMMKILAKNLGHNSDIVMHAINLAKTFGIMDIVSTGEMFMSDMQEMIGHSNSEAIRKAKYRAKIKQKEIEDKRDNVPLLSQKCPDKRPPELELEIELEKDKEASPKRASKEKKKRNPLVWYITNEYWLTLKALGRPQASSSYEACYNIIVNALQEWSPKHILTAMCYYKQHPDLVGNLYFKEVPKMCARFDSLGTRKESFYMRYYDPEHRAEIDKLEGKG